MNYGKKITKVVICGFAEAFGIINNLKASKQVFRVDFIKRSDASIRTMVCKFGVRKGITGTGAAYSFSDKKLLSVYEFAADGFKTIPIDGILGIKTAGVWYSFKELSKIDAKEYNVTKITCGGRTLPASTSPLFNK